MTHLMLTTLVTISAQIMHFVKNNFVFKNGRRVSSKYVTFSVGDRLNIIFSKKYYFYSLFINFIFYKNLRRLGYFHWKFIRFRWNFLKHKTKNMYLVQEFQMGSTRERIVEKAVNKAFELLQKEILKM